MPSQPSTSARPGPSATVPAVLAVLALVLAVLQPGPAPAAATVPPRRLAGAGSHPLGPPPGPVRPPVVRARAALLADEATGQVLFARAASRPLPMASTTKVMTALLAMETLDPDRAVVVGAGPTRVRESSLRLRAGERFTVRQLLLGLLLKSANDSAVALAEAVAGSEAAFVRRMNRRADGLGMTSTSYANPHGLDRPGHHTSARDLARVWQAAMRQPGFGQLVGAGQARLPGRRQVVNSNFLLAAYRWTVGGKTGYTNRAGRCLVASAERGGRRLVAVALGSSNAFADVRALFEYGFRAFVRARLAAAGATVTVQRAGATQGWRVGADVDALVRRDLLATVRLAGSPPAAWLEAGGSRVAGLPLRAAAVTGPVETFRPRPVPAGRSAPTPIDPFLQRLAA